jgi:phosphohistidine phosphatase
MNLYFLRHGDAEERKPGQSDAERALTALGRRQSQDVARWLQEHQIRLDVVITSPLVRARQTAEPVASALGVPLSEDERLSGGQLTLKALEGILADGGAPQRALLVGHEPDLSMIIGELTGGRVDMKKAAVALVKCDRIGPNQGELAWLVPPALRG